MFAEGACFTIHESVMLKFLFSSVRFCPMMAYRSECDCKELCLHYNICQHATAPDFRDDGCKPCPSASDATQLVDRTNRTFRAWTVTKPELSAVGLALIEMVSQADLGSADPGIHTELPVALH